MAYRIANLGIWVPRHRSTAGSLPAIYMLGGLSDSDGPIRFGGGLLGGGVGAPRYVSHARITTGLQGLVEEATYYMLADDSWGQLKEAE